MKSYTSSEQVAQQRRHIAGCREKLAISRRRRRWHPRYRPASTDQCLEGPNSTGVACTGAAQANSSSHNRGDFPASRRAGTQRTKQESSQGRVAGEKKRWGAMAMPLQAKASLWLHYGEPSVAREGSLMMGAGPSTKLGLVISRLGPCPPMLSESGTPHGRPSAGRFSTVRTRFLLFCGGKSLVQDAGGIGIWRGSNATPSYCVYTSSLLRESFFLILR